MPKRQRKEGRIFLDESGALTVFDITVIDVWPSPNSPILVKHDLELVSFTF